MNLFVAIQIEFEESKTALKTKVSCNNGMTTTNYLLKFNYRTNVLS